MSISDIPRKKISPYIPLTIGAICLILSPIFVRMVDVPGPVFGLYRTGIGALILFPFLLTRREFNQARFPIRYLIFPVLGGIFTALDLSFWNTGIHYSTVANVTLIGNAAPLWVALAGWLLFHEKYKPIFWVGLFLTLVGATIVLGYNFLYHPQFSKGDFMALASSFFYAGYYLATQFGRQYFKAASYMWIMSIPAMLTLALISVILGFPLTGYSFKTYLMFIASGVIAQAIGYLCIAYALGRLPASIVAPTLILQPVFSALLAIPLFGEIPQPLQWIGSVIVLVGIYIINRTKEPGDIK